MARWLLAKPSDRDDDAISTAGKLVLTSLPSIRKAISDAAKSIKTSEDLSERGKAKATAKHAVDEVAKFREARSRVVEELRTKRQKAQSKRKEYTSEVSETSRFQIAAWLRGMTPTERGAVLRDAAAGRMAGSEEVMDAVIGSFPRLLGMSDADPMYQMAREQYLARVAPTVVSELGDIDLALDSLNRADEELVKHAEEVAGQDFLDQLAVYEARKPWSELTRDEKIEAVESGDDLTAMMKYGADGFHHDPEAKEERDEWHGLTLEQKIAAVQQTVDDGESITNLIN